MTYIDGKHGDDKEGGYEDQDDDCHRRIKGRVSTTVRVLRRLCDCLRAGVIVRHRQRQQEKSAPCDEDDATREIEASGPHDYKNGSWGRADTRKEKKLGRHEGKRQNHNGGNILRGNYAKPKSAFSVRRQPQFVGRRDLLLPPPNPGAVVDNNSEVDNSGGDGTDEEFSSPTTPTSEEARILAKLTCPTAPRKRKSSLKCNYSGVKEFFITPPDLESVFIRHVERAN